jgi:hypothetical protein
MNFSRRLLFGRSVALRRSGNAAILALRDTEFFGQINPAASANPIIHTSAFPKQHLFQTACGHHAYAGAWLLRAESAPAKNCRLRLRFGDPKYSEAWGAGVPRSPLFDDVCRKNPEGAASNR